MGDGAGTLGKVCWWDVVTDQAWVARGSTGLAVDINVKRRAQRSRTREQAVSSVSGVSVEGL